MKSSEIRQAFIRYFEERGHTHVASASLVPQGDPTLLFTNAGMNQFKGCFLGMEKRAYSRAVTCQKVMRIAGKHNDFENVGVTARHHTFFEMLGNFSFGDYFKKEAIQYGWEFVTKVLGIDKRRLWVTVYEKDDEAVQLWTSLTEVSPDRVVRLGEEDNFWAMGETGPCGPCSEIHVYRGDNVEDQSVKGFLANDGSYLEIWNLVFMQYDRGPGGVLTPLPKPSVDTGMGLERVTSVLQNTQSNYDTDLLRGLIAVCEKLSGFRYDGSSYELRDLRADDQYARDVAMRVIADHSRAATFVIADGVLPGSEGRNYILRRIIRRAVRHGRALGFHEPFLAKVSEHVIGSMGDVYPELRERRDTIVRVIEAEERKFHETLDAGLSILQREVEKLAQDELFPGQVAFQLHDTYGFPLDLTEDALKAYKRKVDAAQFSIEMENQRSRSREDRKAQNLAFQSVRVQGPKTTFLGYSEVEAEATVLEIIASENEPEKVGLIFDATPFYAESGGQVGDTGSIKINGVELRVLDTQKLQDSYFVHQCEIAHGDLSGVAKGKTALLSIDAARRKRIRAHHSATHLAHAALRKVLGTHVKQAGSRVDEYSLRFDYSHFEPVTDTQLADIQQFVNEAVRGNFEVATREMPIDEARASGAMALFGEKYGERVRVVQIGPDSLELCGGTHVGRSGDIGFALLSRESGIAAGVRRIEFLAGKAAELEIIREQAERQRIAHLFKSDASRLDERVERALGRIKSLERELEMSKNRLASAASGSLEQSARTTARGIKVITHQVEASDQDTLRTMVDRLRLKIGSGVVALGSMQGESGVIVAGVTSDLVSTLNAGQLVKEAARVGGGKGGGRADFAQAGGVSPEKLAASLEKIFEMVG